ncbi:Uncharacterised protein [uncultured archaeon]|nr:Uncharacterised protein [uncultured archaeon]
MKDTQQIQTMINQSQQNQSRINDSEVIQLPSNYSQIVQIFSNFSKIVDFISNYSHIIQPPSNESQVNQLPSNDSQINTSQSRDPKIDISSSSDTSGGLLTAEPENIEKRNAVNLSSQGNVSISSDGILVNSSASLAAEDKAQKDLTNLDAAGLDSGLKEKRLVFKTDLSPELEPENIQKLEEVSSGAASSSSAPLNLQVAESIEAEKINAVAKSPKSSTIEFSAEPHKKEGDSGRKSRITTSPSRDQKKLQIAKAPQTSNRNTRSSNLNKKSTNSRVLPRSKKPSR